MAFKKGEGGRPKGAKNKIRKEVEVVLHLDKEDMLREFKAQARAGDSSLMGLYVKLIYPPHTAAQAALDERMQIIENELGITPPEKDDISFI